MKVFCSGISGVGATEHISAVVAYARSRGKDIKVFNVGKEVFKLAEDCGYPITPTGVLDLDKRTIRYLTGAVYQRIAREVHAYEHCIIDGHINFRWRGTVAHAVTPQMISWLEPDIFVTLMDLARPILARLMKDNEQWKYECQRGNVTVANILDWQNFEVTTTEQWAAFHQKPMHVLPTNDSPDSLFKITTQKEVEVVYVSFPITHIRDDAESREKIDTFVSNLRQFKHLAVVSPRAVELPADPSPIEDQHTVMHDLDWFVEKSTKRIFVCFPKRVYSRGVDHESIRAKGSCKEVWFIAPREMDDPFTNSTIHQRFYAPEECIAKLLELGMEKW